MDNCSRMMRQINTIIKEEKQNIKKYNLEIEKIQLKFKQNKESGKEDKNISGRLWEKISEIKKDIEKSERHIAVFLNINNYIELSSKLDKMDALYINEMDDDGEIEKVHNKLIDDTKYMRKDDITCYVEKNIYAELIKMKNHLKQAEKFLNLDNMRTDIELQFAIEKLNEVMRNTDSIVIKIKND